MGLEIERATLGDIDALLSLYFRVYGRHYPLPLGTDPVVMNRLIQSGDDLWLVTRDGVGGPIVGVPGADALLEPE